MSPIDQYPPGFGVNVIGFTTAKLGLGVAARSTIAALLEAQVPVSIVEITLQGRSGVDNTYAHLQISDGSIPRLPYPMTVLHINPAEAEPFWQRIGHWLMHTCNCIVPFWELSTMPDGWIPMLARYDAVLAATDHIAGAIRNSVSTPVRKFPLAANVSAVSPVARREFGIPEDKVAFAATWDTHSGIDRKNSLGVLRALSTAVALGADAVLVVKANNGIPHPAFDRAVASMPPGRVIVISDYLPYDRLLGLYDACDAFISLHRAEGLGLGLQEAMLLGKPIIATGWSGNMDFMDESSALLVPYTFTPVVDGSDAYSPQNLLRQQLWAEPDVLTAAHHIHRLSTDASLRATLGTAAQLHMTAYRDEWRRVAPARLASIYKAHLDSRRRAF